MCVSPLNPEKWPFLVPSTAAPPLQPRGQTQGAHATAQHVAAIVHQLHTRGLRQHHLLQRMQGEGLNYGMVISWFTNPH